MPGRFWDICQNQRCLPRNAKAWTEVRASLPRQIVPNAEVIYPKRLKHVVLPFGPDGSMLVDVICPILFIIQDMDEGDRLCARFHSHNRGVQRQCRACSINFEDLNDPEAFCQFVTQAEIFAVADSDDKELQKQWSTHRHTNAYARAAFGDPI